MSDDVYGVETVKLQIFSLIMIKCWPTQTLGLWYFMI